MLCLKKNSLVLIVDDICVNRMTIKLSLRDDGYDFLEASDGREAVELAIKHKPDVILMDAIMPHMDGFEATKKIRDIESIRRVPILMITALEDKDDKIRALEVGVNDFISKPFDKMELKARCKSYVEISNLNQKYSLATLNSITNLPNKLALTKEISSGGDTLEMFLIKIDNFDENENFYGNKIVSNLEIEFTNLLDSYFSKINNKTIYHISSGKYAVLIDEYANMSKEEVESYCIDLIELVKNSDISSNKHTFNVSITMSFASNSKTLYEDANEVLSKALSTKKEFLLASEVIDDLKKSLYINLKMLNMIKHALKNDGFRPHYQPIFDNRSKTIHKYETLLRMRDDMDNLIYPGPYLLEVAKKGRLYTHITKILIGKVMDKIRETNREFSVNLSSLDIENPKMSSFLLDAIKKNSDITHNLIFELLEDKDTEDYRVVKEFIDIAKSYGVKIAIDDFGSGYSNFMRIIEFEPDIIKIDGSLVCDIATNKNARTTVEMIKLFADRIGAKTVAEYVENEEIYNIINEIGIDYSQGYYIAKATEKLLEEKLFKEDVIAL